MKMKNLIVSTVLVLFSSALFSVVFFGDIGPGRLVKYTLAIALLIGGAILLGALVVSVWSSRQSANTFVGNVSFLVLTSTLVLVAGEYGLHYLYKDVTTTGDSQRYFEKKWQKSIKLNRFGFRERDFELEKSAGTYRIAVIGDSLTFGKGIAVQDRFGNLLEERLNTDNNRRDVSYEVLNFGRPGADTSDETGILNESVLPAAPDFIILQWYKNDVIDSRAKDSMNGERQEPSRISRESARAYQLMVDNSLLFSLLDKQLNRLKQAVASKSDTRLTNFDDKSMWAIFGDPESAGSIRARNALRNFLDLAKKNGVPVGMVLFTDSYFRPASELDYLLERVLEECAREKITCVDMRKPLQPYQGDKKLWASKLDPHPSAFANRITADELFTAFGPLWLDRN